MSNEILKDLSVLDMHTSNMSQYIDEIIKVINDVRTEGYEFYSIVEERKKEYENQIAENRRQLTDIMENLYDISVNDVLQKESELKEKIKSYQIANADMDNNKKILENIGQQCHQLKKTAEVLSENVKQTNSAFEKVMAFLKDAK